MGMTRDGWAVLAFGIWALSCLPKKRLLIVKVEEHDERQNQREGGGWVKGDGMEVEDGM